MRVHELAKEYGIKSTDFVDIIQEFGINIKSHLSSLDDAQVSDIRFKIALKEENEKDDVEVTSTIPETSSIGDTIGSEDTVVESTESVNLEEVSQEITANAKAAAEAREKYAESVASINETTIEEDAIEKVSSDATTSFMEQTVIVEKPTGFWGWLKSIFS